MPVQSLCCFLFSLLCPSSPTAFPSSPTAFLQTAADGETEARSQEGKWLSQAWTPQGDFGSKSRVASTTSTVILQHLFTLQRPVDTQLFPKRLGPGPDSRMGTGMAVSRAGCWEVQTARSQLALAVTDYWWCRTSPGPLHHSADAQLLFACPGVTSFLGHLHQRHGEGQKWTLIRAEQGWVGPGENGLELLQEGLDGILGEIH